MLEPNTNNNLMRIGTKQLFTEASNKTHLDEETIEDWLRNKLQQLITKAFKKGLWERTKSVSRKRNAKEHTKK